MSRASIEAKLPNGKIIELEIRTAVDWGQTWYTLHALWKQHSPVWMKVEGTTHVEINRMFVDVLQFLHDLESGRKSLILDDNSELVVVSS